MRADPVTSEVAASVLARDGRCIAPVVDPGVDLCAGRTTLDHVKDQPAMGIRAPSDRAHLVALCWHYQPRRLGDLSPARAPGLPPDPGVTLVLVPVTLTIARRFVAENHRHNRPPPSWLFGVGLEDDGELVAIAMAGRPIARLQDDGRTLEITRVCVRDGTRNANSKLLADRARA